jgi:hypothetical protein
MSSQSTTTNDSTVGDIPNWGASGDWFDVIEYVPIKFEIADDLSYWNAEVPGKIIAKAEALTGPTTPPW